MKKTLLALAALTALAGVASAQSSVTLFGIVDLNVRNVKNAGGSVTSLSQDGNFTSRFGLRGVEDLGGGLRAGFWLEASLNPDTGGIGGSAGAAGTSTFNRRSIVSLIGNFGEIRLGREYTPSFWNHTVFDPLGLTGVGSNINIWNGSLGSGATTFFRANNSVGYILPSLGGLYGQVMVAAGEGLTGNKYYGGRIGYAAGPVNVAVAHGKTDKTGTMLDDYTVTNIGASFRFGAVTLFAQYAISKYDPAGPGKEEQKLAMLGATASFGQSMVKASFTKTSGDTRSAATKQYDAKQMVVGYQYDLSKRTALYATASRINNEGNATTGANFVVGGPGGAQTRGANSTGYEFGVRHNF